MPHHSGETDAGESDSVVANVAADSASQVDKRDCKMLRAVIWSYPPPPNEETDERLHDIGHRTRGVSSGHNTSYYKVVKSLRPHRRPASPNPFQPRSEVSKCRWEKSIMEWREALLDIAKEIEGEN